jgi:succinoglycan biosynthesis protein ExoW
MYKITIIIPFFQREQGILAKAIRSVFAQRDFQDWTVIVIDDGSPISAKDELKHYSDHFGSKINIFKIDNSGPAAARNYGLDRVDQTSEFVAFLDSDDEWSDTHLVNALSALEFGHDFYFSDHMQLNAPVSAFVRAGRLKISDHDPLPVGRSLYFFKGNFFNQILTGNLVGTSTVVYRFKTYNKLRFREAFVYAGEDYLFWMELSLLTDKIAFSTECECVYGAGVNIFSGSGWGTKNSLIRTHYEMKFNKAIIATFQLNTKQREICSKRIKEIRRRFVADILHRLAHRREIDRYVLKKQWLIDPLTFVMLVPIAVGLVLNR